MKNRYTAAVLAFFLGGLGVHKFYLGKWTGIFYLIFCWTYVPSIIALIECILYLVNGEEDFNEKYNNVVVSSKSHNNNYVSNQPIIPQTSSLTDTSDIGVVCPECGHINEAGSNFCESCGKKL